MFHSRCAAAERVHKTNNPRMSTSISAWWQETYSPPLASVLPDPDPCVNPGLQPRTRVPPSTRPHARPSSATRSAQTSVQTSQRAGRGPAHVVHVVRREERVRARGWIESVCFHADDLPERGGRCQSACQQPRDAWSGCGVRALMRRAGAPPDGGRGRGVCGAGRLRSMEEEAWWGMVCAGGVRGGACGGARKGLRGLDDAHCGFRWRWRWRWLWYQR
ncbi:hypothetical protein BJ912DRAFT_1106815 [Pholiota molesta]|nr:hypothetical protein BJ912DRAFT_1106815 [Pholiota molesta]